MSKRRRFSAAEKAKIALEAIRGELTLAQISSKYNVHATQINQWKRQALEQLPTAFTNPTKQLQADHESELQLLYEQIGRLKIEKVFLKKSVTCFPNDRHVLLEPEHPNLSLRAQCQLLVINRSRVYYKPKERSYNVKQLTLLRIVDELYNSISFFWDTTNGALFKSART